MNPNGETEKRIDCDQHAYQKWKYEQNRALAERAHDEETQFGIKTNEAAVASGTLAVRTMLIINGGAAVALLAFIGQVVTLANGKFSDKLGELTVPLSWFAWGVALAAVSTACAYLANYCMATAQFAKIRTYEHPFIQPTKASKYWSKACVVFQCISVLAGAVSLILFLVGMTEVRDAIRILK